MLTYTDLHIKAYHISPNLSGKNLQIQDAHEDQV